MFVGHYAAGLALKSVDKRASLGMLFLGVQFVDILFFPFVLMGIEKFNLVLNHTESTHFDLEFMPYTHSLLATGFWSLVVFLGFIFLRPGTFVENRKVALIMATAVASHWFLDLIVHTPDLPLLGDASTKVGFGLWNNAVATYGLEALLLLIGLVLYMRITKAENYLGRWGMPLFVVLLLAVNASNIFGPPLGSTVTSMSLAGIASYIGFAGIAFWLDRKRC